MFETTVIHIRDMHKHRNTVYIGRSGKGFDGYFGNEHPIGWCSKCKCNHDRQKCLAAFNDDFLVRLEKDQEYRRRVLALKGKVLVCFCVPEECHGDILAEWIDEHACKSCLGYGSHPITLHTHGSVQPCERCKGNGEEPTAPGSEHWWLNAPIVGARGVNDSILRLLELNAITRAKAMELLKYAEPRTLSRSREEASEYLPVWPKAPWDKLEWGD
jgi:hypothetical protein